MIDNQENLDPREIMSRVQPPIPEHLRQALIDRKLVHTHKDAQERFVAPYLAELSAQQAVQVEPLEPDSPAADISESKVYAS